MNQTPSTIDRLVIRSAEERWSSARLDAAIATTRERRGKPCGASHIPSNRTCHKGSGALTPLTVAAAPRKGTWRRRAGKVAGVTAVGLAVGLPTASFLASGSPAGRRASIAAERLTRNMATGFGAWGGGPLAPVGMPLAMGLQAGAEGMRVGRTARRIGESWAAAPGFARGTAGLAERKGASAEARASYLEQLQKAWLTSNKPTTPAESRRRTKEVRKVEQQIAKLGRQEATRQRAATRAARIGRTGTPFRTTPTPSERWMQEALQRDPVRRTPAALSAGLLRGMQAARSGLNRRQPKFYATA